MTFIEISGRDFLIDGRPTYEGRYHEGRRIEGLLLNSRMVQAIFDDADPATAVHWKYPDTGRWDPERNTDEFCAMLPIYRNYGLLGVTVGLQGGGAVYSEEIFGSYLNSAFSDQGELQPSYMARLERVLAAADGAGIVVIVNFFYWKQQRFASDAAVLKAAANATNWLLQTGRRNVLIDVKNEVQEGDDLLSSRRIHEVLDEVRGTTLNGRRIPVGTSTFPTNHLPEGEWPQRCDFFMPHGNNSDPQAWRNELRAFQSSDPVLKTTRPILCNEDSVDIANLDVSIDEGVSWGYYDQGFGCRQKQPKIDWTQHERETEYEALSGFQTVPVNWAINTPHKRAFFDRVAEVTGSKPLS
jgi:hypothetical protein